MRSLGRALAVLALLAFAGCGGSDAVAPAPPPGDLDGGPSGQPGADGGPGASDSGTSTDGQARTAPLRVMAANISSGPALDYAAPASVRILKGLQPDIVVLQEFNVGGSTAAELGAFVADAFGPSFVYYREPDVQIPNGVVSRYPILESGRWVDPYVANRSFVYAKIGVPGAKPLWAVSLHLLTTNATQRDAEANALVTEIKKTIPAADYLVVGGDLNTGSRQESCITTLSALVSPTPTPDDGAGNENTNAPRNKPHDWLMADPDLGPAQVPTFIGGRSFPGGLVFDSRVFTPLQDVAPITVDDSGSQNMQHMPVVKDFRLPL